MKVTHKVNIIDIITFIAIIIIGFNCLVHHTKGCFVVWYIIVLPPAYLLLINLLPVRKVLSVKLLYINPFLALLLLPLHLIVIPLCFDMGITKFIDGENGLIDICYGTLLIFSYVSLMLKLLNIQTFYEYDKNDVKFVDYVMTIIIFALMIIITFIYYFISVLAL